MSFETFGDLNWLAVVVAAVAYFLLGGIWYAPPVMGNAWMKASGVDMTEGEDGPGPVIFMAPLLGYLVAATATAMLAKATGSDTLSEGLVLGLIVGVGYAVVMVGVVAVFEANKPSSSTWAVITATYNLLGLLITAVIVSVWT